MKIVIFCQVFYPDPSSVGQHMFDLASELAKKNDVTVITSRNNSNNFNEIYSDKETYKNIKIKRYRNLFGNKKIFFLRFLNQIVFSFQILIYGIINNIDKLIITTNPIFSSLVGSVIYYFKRNKIYYWVMDINPDEAIVSKVIKRSIFTNIFDFFNSYMLKNSKHVFTLDKYMLNNIKKKSLQVKATVIPPWPHENVLTKKNKKNPFKEKYKLKNKFVIMYSGNQTFINPLESFLKIAKKLDSDNRFKCIIIGNGNLHQKIIEYKYKFNLKNLLILDYLPIQDIKFSLNSANLHVVTLGNKMKGIIHPCKIYNLIVLKKPILYFGPKESHISDIIRKFKIGLSFRHSEVKKAKKAIINLKNKKLKIKKIQNPFKQKNLVKKMVHLIYSS